MLTAALVLIMLTSLDGSPIWVESTAIVIIRPTGSGKQCAPGVGAAIRVGTNGLCVKETPDEIRRKIKDAN